MDGLNRFTRTKDITIVGKGQSELEDYLKQEAEKDGGYISYESHPEAGYYTGQIISILLKPAYRPYTLKQALM